MSKKRPITAGHLDVGQDHSIYYESYGNPEGIPILFLHGGPGLGCSDQDKRFFDPHKFFVIFFDQRACGRSFPLGNIEYNSTEYIVQDIIQLLDFFKIDKVHLFGGSWGSLLALYFGIKYPEKVASMILRGVFYGNLDNINFTENGGGAHLFFPQAWEEYRTLVPIEFQDHPAKYYYQQISSTDQETVQKYAKAYYQYLNHLATLKSKQPTYLDTLSEVEIVKLRIQLYYSTNQFFHAEAFIFDHCFKLDHIPIQIIHGRYDMICPPFYVYQLKKRLKNATLQFVHAGHISSEPEIEKALLKALDKIA